MLVRRRQRRSAGCCPPCRPRRLSAVSEPVHAGVSARDLTKFSCKGKPLVVHIFTHQCLKAWLVDRHDARFKSRDFLRIDIDADHLGTEFRETCA